MPKLAKKLSISDVRTDPNYRKGDPYHRKALLLIKYQIDFKPWNQLKNMVNYF